MSIIEKFRNAPLETKVGIGVFAVGMAAAIGAVPVEYISHYVNGQPLHTSQELVNNLLGGGMGGGVLGVGIVAHSEVRQKS